MATESAPRLNGTIPGDSSTKPVRDPHDEVQGFWKAVKSFTSKNGFESLTSLIERDISQRVVLKQKDSEILDLKNQLATCDASHSAYNNEQYLNFEKRFQEWGKQNANLRRDANDLATASEEKAKNIVTLNQELQKCKTQFDDLDKAYAEMTKELKSRGQLIGDFDTKLQNAQYSENGLKEKLKKSYNCTAAFKKSLEERTAENKRLKEENSELGKTIEEYRGFSVEIEELDLTAKDWTKLNDNKAFKNDIPLPQNNAPISKQMRVAVTLGALARLVIKFLFQPTYLVEDYSGLRKALRYQAVIDPRKEMYTRGILLSMLPDDQEQIDEEIIDFILEDLERIVCVDVLFASHDDFDRFSNALQGLLIQFQKQWKQVQRGRQKLEPSPDVHASKTGYPWYVVDFPVAVQDQKRTSSPPTTANAQDGTVIVPQIIRMREQAEPEPVTPGWVLQQAHIHAADEELLKIRRSLRSVSVVEETSNRPRNRKRTMSITADAKNADSFLR
ncbi:uncharacterized protein N0V89_012050 [Didymosphaeria variabile]|uniref:Uncharacterized protein n=1 Tax=Didymosphaeria variabile TaxID=1932322 RepID=A0A9W8XB47_9PLEO|nr:uncharacterized protein N0V89_012050 [Didymosphaeria variabile]KAJ4345914.1 hypothetical protein N0V89_012050 [Didymosphaeria variabile]